MDSSSEQKMATSNYSTLSTGYAYDSTLMSTRIKLQTRGHRNIRACCPFILVGFNSCRLLLQVSYGCLRLSMVAYKLGVVPQKTESWLRPRSKARVDGLHVLQRPRPSFFLFCFFMIQVWKELWSWWERVLCTGVHTQLRSQWGLKRKRALNSRPEISFTSSIIDNNEH